MPSFLPGYQYDIFISYRQKDNRSDQWVTHFTNALREELDATFKEPISIYFDSNPHDGLQDHHEVDDSLRQKLKCLIFIPIVSRTYCDPHSFAWSMEFQEFLRQASADDFGLKIKLPGGNVANRVLPVRIHEIGAQDAGLFEHSMGGIMRPIDFIYKESGVNRPLLPTGEKKDNKAGTDYRNQLNKVANAIHDILVGIQQSSYAGEQEGTPGARKAAPFREELKRRNMGSVRKAGKQIRIIGPVDPTSDDRHLWANDFTAKYTVDGLFGIQRQIADNIVRELELQLTPEEIENITQKISDNKEAYEHFLLGNQYYDIHNFQANQRTIQEYKKATDLDSTFGRAYGGLASSLMQLVINYGYERQPWRDSIWYYVKKGIALDKRCAECYKALAQTGDHYMDNMKKAVEYNPSYIPALTMLQISMVTLARYDTGFMLLERLVGIDPLDAGAAIANTLRYIDLEKSKEYYLAAARTKPPDITKTWQLGYVLADLGDPEASRISERAYTIGRDLLQQRPGKPSR